MARMRRLITRLLADERVRFTIVGGINTAVGYGLFALFYLLFGKWIGYIASLYASYFFATLLAFYLHRRFTFRVAGTGSLLMDFLRFQGVYVIALIINTVALPLLVELAHMHALVAQALIVILTTVLSYVGHKFFSFRRAEAASDAKAAQDQGV
jgi:putative flippase GtrA